MLSVIYNHRPNMLPTERAQKMARVVSFALPGQRSAVRERVGDDERAKALAVVQVFRVELIAAGFDCCLHNHRIPEMFRVDRRIASLK